MIKLPDFDQKFNYENDFYLSCESSRIAKSIAQYKLFEKTANIKGDIVECGVFKGASFSRFAMFREILNIDSKKIIGFDSFDDFPETKLAEDKDLRDKFILEAGGKSISENQLHNVLAQKHCDKNIQLIKGDIVNTVPSFVKSNQDLKISILNLDVDIYEPSVVILEHLYPLISNGGIMILDDYNTFHGETNAINEFIADKDITIHEPLFINSPYFIIKED